MNVNYNLKESLKVLKDFISDSQQEKNIISAGLLMVDSIRGGGKIIACGNGGSLCDAMHFAEELSGRFRESRKALPAISISDPSHLSCVANDYGYKYVFSRYLEALGQCGDVLLVISTSGNSENVIMAAQAAKEKGLQVVGLTGNGGGKLASLCDIEIRVPWNGYSDRIQEIHIKVIHNLIWLIEQELL